MEQFFPGLTSAPNLHPMVVHFPIAFWIAAAGAWALALVRKSDNAWRFGLWLHSLGLLGAGVAIAFGFWATAEMGHDSPGHDLVHVHRDIMIWTTGVSVVITGLAWWKHGPRWRVPLVALSVVLVGLLTFGADRGAELVFRYGMGVAHEAPPESGHSHAHGDDHGAHEPDEDMHGDAEGTPAQRDATEKAASPDPTQQPPTPATKRGPHGHDHSHGDHEH